jgi:hypothetical protein
VTDPREDSSLFLLAVQQGALSQSQINDCLHAWQERHGGAAPAPPIHELAVEKGYLSRERVKELSGRAVSPAASVVSVLVALRCPKCGRDREMTLDAALRSPVCPECSLGLEVSPSDAGAVTVKTGPLPVQVDEAAKDPANRFGKYVLLERLGAGGMGEVVKAWDRVLQRPVALKFPRQRSADDVQRMYVEAQGAGRLAHPNLAAIYEAGELEGRPYIAMQFIDGTTADAALPSRAADRDPRVVARWVREAALAADYAHQAGVVHRDLKPSNLMVDREGRVYVMDFGLAKLKSGSTTQTISGMVLGTPSYMPPEQAAARPHEVDAQSDVYALGATLYVLLTGEKPYEGETATDILVKILTADPVPLRKLRPDAPWELEAVVEKAMRRKKEERYRSARELAEDLGRYLGHEPVLARPATLAYRIRKRAARHPGQIVLIGVAAAAVLGLAAVLLFRAGPAPDRTPEWLALLEPFRKAAASDGFDAPRAAELRARMERGFPDRSGQVADFLEQEHRLVSRLLEELPRDRWLASRDRVKAWKSWLEFAGKPTAPADRILAWRGACTIAVYVLPWAKLDGPLVASLPEEDRTTPVSFAVEVAEGELELSHPVHGSRRLRIEGLEDGGRYLVEGDWRDPDRIALRRER